MTERLTKRGESIPPLAAALGLAAVAMLGSARIAGAEPEAEHATVVARESLYADDDATVISTSTIAVHGKATDEVTVSARYVADAVSSASIDVVTAATERWDEIRSEWLAGAAWDDGTWTLSGTYIYSIEEDWWSHTGSLALSRDFLDHNLTLGVGASYVANQVGRADDPNFDERLGVAGASARAVWVAGEGDLLSAVYTLARGNGYQASPYRFAFVADPSGVPIGHPEVDPDLRTRHSVTLRWNHHLLDDAALRSHVRAYADDWGVRSLTAGTELAIGLGPIEVGGNLRVYAQRHADFYQDVYDMPRRYMTSDRELSSFQDVFGGARGRWIHERVEVDLGVTGFAFRFPEFGRLPTRLGVVADVGVVVGL